MHAPIVLYPDPHAAPFTPPCAIPSYVAQRRCGSTPLPAVSRAYFAGGF